MSYTHPKDVLSPQVSISNLKPVLNMGEWDFAIAVMHWERELSVGIRWNGATENGKMHPGNPQSRGLPTWFILPPELAVPVLKAARELGLKGEGINEEDAKEVVRVAIAALESKQGGRPNAISEEDLEVAIVKTIRRLREAGEL